MSSEKWMYVGCAVIVASNALQFVSTNWPSFLPSLHLALAGIVINTVSVIFTIIQAKRSANETSQEIWKGTLAGHIKKNLDNPDSRPPVGEKSDLKQS